MGEEGKTGPESVALSDRRRRVVRLLGLALLVGAAISFLGDLEFKPWQVEIPLRPLTVGPELRRAAALPGEPGALEGASLLLVTLDTTRPDRLGLYGNHEIETPHLDRLAQRGVVFSNARSTTPTTLPSHASILTGLQPYHHGARVNGRFRLSPHAKTLAEILAGRGYATAAFVSAYVLDPRFGLDRGFDVYDAETGEASTTLGFAERKADATTDAAIQWLRTQRERPFFLWVHYFDPHMAYAPPEPFASRYDNAYDGEIAFVDHELGRLLTALETPRGPETLIVVTADHGEALGEGGEPTHGFLLQEATLRIPLLVHAPDLEGGVHVDAPVSQVDLLPTILSLLGVDVPEGLDGADLLRPPTRQRPILAETLEGRIHFGWAALSTLIQGPLKFVDGPSPELYDLSQDPLAKSDVISSRGEDAARLRRRLRELRGPGADDPTPAAGLLEGDEAARLRALGYVVSEDLPGPDSASPGADPQQMLPMLNRVMSLVGVAELGPRPPAWQRALAWLTGNPLPTNTGELIAALEELAAEHPGFAPTHVMLHELYLEAKRPEDAERTMQQLKRAR